MRRGLARQRDFWPRIDRRHPLGSGLLFAALGGGASTLHYADASGYGNAGTLTNMTPEADWVWDGTLNRWALDFDGTNDCVAYASHIPALALTGEMTILMWHRANGDYTSQQSLAWTLEAGGVNSYWGLSFGKTNNKYDWYQGAYVSGNITAISTDAWNYIAATRTGTSGNWSINYFLNGLADGTQTTATDPNGTTTSLLSIGRAGGYAGLYNNGRLADVLIYNWAISASMIAELADPSNVMLSGLILPPRRRLWAVTGGAPPATIIPRIMRHRRLIGAA